MQKKLKEHKFDPFKVGLFFIPYRIGWHNQDEFNQYPNWTLKPIQHYTWITEDGVKVCFDLDLPKVGDFRIIQSFPEITGGFWGKSETREMPKTMYDFGKILSDLGCIQQLNECWVDDAEPVPCGIPNQGSI